MQRKVEPREGSTIDIYIYIYHPMYHFTFTHRAQCTYAYKHCHASTSHYIRTYTEHRESHTHSSVHRYGVYNKKSSNNTATTTTISGSFRLSRPSIPSTGIHMCITNSSTIYTTDPIPQKRTLTQPSNTVLFLFFFLFF